MSTKYKSSFGLAPLAVAALTATPITAGADIINISESAFQAGSGLITFEEPGFSLGTTNPTYTASDYGGGSDSPTVEFDGFYQGQTLGDASTCPSGAALSGCVVGAPSDPLSLDPDSPETEIVTDGAFPSTPTLSGTPTFNGPISLLFSESQFGVGLEGGFFDAIGGTAITAYGEDGSEIGSVTNTQEGIEFLGLVTDDRSDSIAGLQFSLVGDEPAGFNIDNVRFGTVDQVRDPTSVPLPASLWLMMAGLVGLISFHGGRRSLKR